MPSYRTLSHYSSDEQTITYAVMRQNTIARSCKTIIGGRGEIHIKTIKLFKTLNDYYCDTKRTQYK